MATPKPPSQEELDRRFREAIALVRSGKTMMEARGIVKGGTATWSRFTADQRRQIHEVCGELRGRRGHAKRGTVRYTSRMLQEFTRRILAHSGPNVSKSVAMAAAGVHSGAWSKLTQRQRDRIQAACGFARSFSPDQLKDRFDRVFALAQKGLTQQQVYRKVRGQSFSKLFHRWPPHKVGQLKKLFRENAIKNRLPKVNRP